MTRLLFPLQAASDLYLGTQKPYGQFLETRTYVPGRTLRGALAAVFLAGCPPERQLGGATSENCSDCPLSIGGNCRFYDLFAENDSTRFEHCYPEHPNHQATKIPADTQILPLTARSCKAEPGFTRVHDYLVETLGTRLPSETRPHGVFDVLIPHLVYYELDRVAGPLPLVWMDRCPVCLEDSVPFDGFYETLGMTPQLYYQPRARSRRSTRTAISRMRQAAQPGQLFSIELVDEGQRFTGSIVVPDELEKAVREGLRRLAQEGQLGGGGGQGLGRVVLARPIDVQEEETAFEVMTRMEQFNSLVAEYWQEWRVLTGAAASDSPSGTFFTLDLQSEALLPDSWGRPTLALEAQELSRLLQSLSGTNSPLPPWEAAGCYVAPAWLSGWSAAWRLPDEVRLAAAAGSVFVFRTRTVCEGEPLRILADALAALQARGLGFGGRWGLGRVRVCHPFHLEVMGV